MVHKGRAQAVLAAVGKYQDPGLFLQWVDEWSLRDLVFVFCPVGTIPITFFNGPGSVHESQVAHWGRVYDKLGAVYNKTGRKCRVDSAFGKVNRPFLIKSSQDYLVSTMPTRQEQRLDLQRKQQATLV